jgi:mono/diheme cytochrome c family protein
MKHFSHRIATYYLPVKTITVLGIIISAIVLMSFTIKKEAARIGAENENTKDSVASVKAFNEVYKVLMSPRCVNCHPSGDVPLQGDDSHLHAMLPKRGADGKGVYAMKCSNCHQPTNLAGLNKPPGHPNWHLPPANMKMVFQGRTPAQLARQLVNPKTNGNKTMAQLIAHADDGLVKAGWNPGEGRTVPPLTHAEFKKAWITWLKTGAYAPKSK